MRVYCHIHYVISNIKSYCLTPLQVALERVLAQPGGAPAPKGRADSLPFITGLCNNIKGNLNEFFCYFLVGIKYRPHNHDEARFFCISTLCEGWSSHLSWPSPQEFARHGVSPNNIKIFSQIINMSSVQQQKRLGRDDKNGCCVAYLK